MKRAGWIAIVSCLDPFAVRSTHPAGKGPDGLHLLPGGISRR